jgi:hypothetical protein
MGIVPAGVHHAGHLGSVCDLVGFLDGQGVHVGAEAYRWGALAKAPYDAGSADARLDGQPHVTEGI